MTLIVLLKNFVKMDQHQGFEQFNGDLVGIYFDDSTKLTPKLKCTSLAVSPN